MIQHVVDAARGLGAFGSVALLAFLIVPDRFLKQADLDRLTGVMFAVAEVIIACAIVSIVGVT